MSFGSTLIALRKERGYSRKELAEALSIPYTTLRNYETGQREPGHMLLIRMAAQLGVSVDELIGNTGGISAQPTPLSAKALHIGKLYDAADDHDQLIVETTLKPYEGRLSVKPAAPAAPPRIAAFPEKKRRADGFDEILVFEDQLPAAGYGSYFDSRPQSHIEQYPAGLVPEKATFGVPVGGDSMEPAYKNHATAFIQGAPRIENGEIGLFSLNGAPYIKQLIIDEEKHEVWLHSLNSRYPDIPVHEFDDLRTFGRVLGSYPQ